MAKPLSKEQASKLDVLLNLEDRGMLSCDLELIRLKSIPLGHCAACDGLGEVLGFEGRKKVVYACEYCK